MGVACQEMYKLVQSIIHLEYTDDVVLFVDSYGEL